MSILSPKVHVTLSIDVRSCRQSIMFHVAALRCRANLKIYFVSESEMNCWVVQRMPPPLLPQLAAQLPPPPPLLRDQQQLPVGFYAFTLSSLSSLEITTTDAIQKGQMQFCDSFVYVHRNAQTLTLKIAPILERLSGALSRSCCWKCCGRRCCFQQRCSRCCIR